MKPSSKQSMAPEESIEEYCRRIGQELSAFFNTSRWRTTQLDEYVDPPDPADLPIQSTAVLGDITRGQLYSEELLPRFLDSCPLLDYEKSRGHETFQAVLEKAVSEFSEKVSPLIHDGHVYYLRLTPKAGYSLPSDVRKRRDYMETHPAFEVKYYRHSEEAFFKLCNYYVNLYTRNYSAQTRNGRLQFVVFVGSLLLIGLLIGLLSTWVGYV